MVAKVRADFRASEIDTPKGAPADGAPSDLELEAEVQAVALWFNSLPAEVRSHFDHEARHGREAYPTT